MLYKLNQENNVFKTLEPLEYRDFSHFGQHEKDLENLIAESLFEQLYEDNRLMTIFQERARQSEADIYALDESGSLHIFELKRSGASGDAVIQILKYAQDSGQWGYSKLQSMWGKYITKLKQPSENELKNAHRETFDLPEPLQPEQFNMRQHLVIVGSSADIKLTRFVDYWKHKGISIDFLPYRIFEIEKQLYFEFFSLPYDFHTNPKDIKGALFDTCRTWDENAIWTMMEDKRVYAWGGVKKSVTYVKSSDFIFFYHKGKGLAAAARVKDGRVGEVEGDGLYRDVEFITPVPKRGSKHNKFMSVQKIREITGKNFFWARTIKYPYLSKDEAEKLAEELDKYLKSAK